MYVEHEMNQDAENPILHSIIIRTLEEPSSCRFEKKYFKNNTSLIIFILDDTLVKFLSYGFFLSDYYFILHYSSTLTYGSL